MDSQNFYLLAHRISCSHDDVQRMYEEIKALIDRHAAPLTIYVMQEEGTDTQWWSVLVGTTHPDPGIIAQIQKALATRDAQVTQMTPAVAEWFVKDYIARQIEKVGTPVERPPAAQARARGKRSADRRRTRKKKERH